MTLFLDRIDSAPVSDSDFSNLFVQWISVLIDTLNETLQTLQDSINFLEAPNYTATQITTLFGQGDIGNGILLYDTTNNVYVGIQNGALVKFTTTPYP